MTPPTTLLGVDIGGTKIAAALVRADTGAVLLQDRVATRAETGGAAVLARALDLGQSLAARAARENIAAPVAVGVGAGGQIDPQTGVVLSATDLLPGWAGTRLADAFTTALALPARADNDVNAFASGESRWGAGRGEPNLVFIALGTGVGGAFLSNGRLHHGARGGGGEVGHLVLIPNGLSCTCGNRGCWEQYTSGAALVRFFQAEGGDTTSDGPAIAQNAHQNPGGTAARAVCTVGQHLGLGLVSLANLFAPNRFILGGGLASGLGDLLLAPARDVLHTRALPLVRQTPITLAALGPDAPVIGAASLALPFVESMP